MPEQLTGNKLTASIGPDNVKIPTLRTVVVWSVVGNLARLISLGLIGGLGAVFASLYSMQNAQPYSIDQWNSAVQTRGDLVLALWATMVLSIALLSRKSLSARAFLSTLPLVPTVQSARNPTAAAVPMAWPPVPEGGASPLRRISGQVAMAIPGMWGLSWIAAIQLDGNLQPSTTKYLVLVTLCVLSALTGLLAIVLDVLRLRGWGRWSEQVAALNQQPLQTEQVA